MHNLSTFHLAYSWSLINDLFNYFFIFSFTELKQVEWRKQSLKWVLENRCSESCSLNGWNIPMKKYIFSKVADWEPATLLKMNFIRCIFQGFWLRISPGNFPLRRPIFIPEHLCFRHQRMLPEWKKSFEIFFYYKFFFPSVLKY